MLLLCKKFILAGGSSPYTPGQVLINSDSGTVPSSIEILSNGVYELRLIGGGGRYYRVFSDSGAGWTGGSSGGFVGNIRLTKGIYAVAKGAFGSGNSVFGDAISRGGGAAGLQVVGAAGAKPTIPYTIVSYTVHRAGNTGAFTGQYGGSGGAPVYGNYGRGAGISIGAYVYPAGTAGLVYLAYVGR